MSREEFGISERHLGAFEQNVVSLGVDSQRIIVDHSERGRGHEIRRKLEKLVRLPKGWDGYAARPVSLLTAFFSAELLAKVCASETPLPVFVPGPSGDLQLEWRGLRSQIEVHILAPNRVEAFREGSDGVDDEIFLTTDFTQLADWLEDFERAETDDKQSATG